MNQHEFDDDAVCIHCGFDGAEWHWWKRHTYEGLASDLKRPVCIDRKEEKRGKGDANALALHAANSAETAKEDA